MNVENYLDELQSLVNIDCGTCTPAGVTAVARIMQEKYQQLGWHAELVDLGAQVGNGVFATNKPQATQFDVLLVGHMDTVFPEGTVAQRPMSVKEGRVYGPGASDMKGGLLNILYALRSLDADTAQRLSIAVAMNPDEETGSLHSHKWIGEIAKRSRCVLVAEAARADGSLVKARKGIGGYSLKFHGKAAHAGNDPERGRSAINELAHTILFINTLSNVELGTTLNVGVVDGGSAGNVVADYAHAELDVRFWQNDDFARVHDTLMALNERSFTPDVKVEIVRHTHKPAMTPSADTEALMALVEAVGQEQGLDVRWQSVGGGSDANHTAALGIPSLDGFGPIGACFHSADEYLEIASIEPRINLLRGVLNKL